MTSADKWQLIVNLLCIIASAVTAGFSAYFAYQLTEYTKFEWDSKNSSIVVAPGLFWLQPQGLLSTYSANTGSRSATEVRVFQTAYTCKKDGGVFPAGYFEDNFFKPNKVNESKIANTYSGGYAQNYSDFVPFTVSETQSVKMGQEDFYLLSHVTYKDGYGKPRETRMCQSLSIISDVPLQVGGLRPCPVFNCLDDDCRKQVFAKKTNEQEQKCSIYTREVKPFNLQPLSSKTVKKKH